MRHVMFPSLLALALGGCQPATPPAADSAATPADAAPAQAAPASGPEISAEDFAEHVKVLASDEYAGRAPGGRGEELTTEYIKQQFERLGLKPGNGDSWFQNVPMVAITADPKTTITIKQGDSEETLSIGPDMVIGTLKGEPEIKVEDSEMVFIGYGVDAPEADWNDYSVDVTGKTVVMLVNDPGFHVGSEELFQGKRMTYYGRWTYKFEEAARKGAAAALIIHDTEGAGYGWDVVQNSWSGEQFDLPSSLDPAPRLPAQGWISSAQAGKLFSAAGTTLEAMRTAANQPGFKPVPLKARFSTTIKSTVRQGESKNVVGMLPGSERPDEAVVYMGHWDHLGHNEEMQPDGIFNGAIDNATGIAGIIEIAEAFVTQNPPPKRSVIFLAVTLEESGLLGSKYFAAQPTLPLANIVGAINLDAMPLVGKTRDMTVIGLGNSELEDVLRKVAEGQGRVLKVESGVEKGFYYRSDHFSFAKAGVPALYAKGGIDHVEGGEAQGLAWQAAYTADRYHKPADEFDPSWDLSGVIQDLEALYAVGRELAGSEAWPNWYEGNEFRAARDALRPPAEATE
ncbi:M28 family metallopeptidase [Pseudomarimonas salicorniae]|uniref:M28 family metallopeptidase n=1 Tax=Pseudomarimonas salicorniae TaxID=2933270 RepID=A0ABT0GDN2_9GAMM|nr:M28 family metallopeptidase [Lysobacter sp. CAU 1642]MCK7592259.1 M28 family metallopeptidase [Lysobacter sp. CAU 1642]